MILLKKECGDIAKLLSVPPRSSVLPILECTRIGTDKDKGLFFQVTNLDYFATCYVGGEGLPDLMIDTNRLKSALGVSIMGGDAVIYEKDGNLSIQRDSAKLRLISSYKVNDFPLNEVGIQEKVLTVPTKDFEEKIACAMKFVSNDDLRPAMTYVLMQANGVSCTVVATDAHRMYYDSFDTACAATFDILVPQRLCKLMLNCIKGQSGEVRIYKRTESGKHSIEFGNYRFDFRAFDGRYPTWEVVVKPELFSVFLNRQSLKNSLVMANAFSTSYTRKCVVEYKKGDSSITISASDEGDCDFSMNIAIEKPPTEDIYFHINAKFFLDVLKTVNKKDAACKLSITGNTTSALIIDNKVMLMPLLAN
jgi:DNA polymerase III sliding clamp (beta) subunit (PCNA family)